MNSVVLDTSAVLALLRRERGAAFVEKRLAGAAICAVNYSELIQKAVEHGGNVADARAQLDFLQLSVIPLDAAMAGHAAGLWPAAREFGLSFADRCCLALAASLDRPVLTANRSWGELDIEITVELIR